MEFNVNWLAVLVAALSSFLVGFIWYHKSVFGTIWMKECGFTDDSVKNASMGKIFGLTFVFSFIMAANLAMFLQDPPKDCGLDPITAGNGAFYGFLTGFGWVAMSTFVTGLFEMKSWTYMLINAGYHVVGLTLMGLILGAWR